MQLVTLPIELYIYVKVSVCAFALITCTIITSRTMLPRDLTWVDFFDFA